MRDFREFSQILQIDRPENQDLLYIILDPMRL